MGLSLITSISDLLSRQMLFVHYILSVGSNSMQQSQNVFSILDKADLVWKGAIFTTVEKQVIPS